MLRPPAALRLAANLTASILNGLADALEDGEIEPLEVFRIAIDAINEVRQAVDA